MGFDHIMIAAGQGRWWCPMCTGSWGWGMMAMWLFWILVIALVVWVLVRGGRLDWGRGQSRSIEILKERYARGEIDLDTYRRMLQELQGPHAP
jgi:putative membrane protein